MFVAEARLAFVALPSCRADVWISFPIAGDEAYERSKGGTIVVLLCMLRLPGLAARSRERAQSRA